MHTSSLQKLISFWIIAALLTGAVLSGLPAPVVQASPSLDASAVNYATGATPRSIAVGDINADGTLDLVTANATTTTISILLGKSDGTFNRLADLSVGTSPFSVVAGDFNSDGKLDVATANFASDQVSVLLGNGNGTFQAKVNYATADGPIAIATSDVNRDGKLDLAAAALNAGSVSVLLGNGNGTFQAPVNYSVGAGPRFVLVSDLNLDGKLDLVTSNDSGNNISVLLGEGNGTFQAQVTYPVVGGPFSIASGDFNRDGIPDLAVTTQNNSKVNVLLGSGNGAFLPATSYTAGTSPYSVAVSDLNDDGQSDLVVANAGSSSVSTLFGDGSGAFQLANSDPVGSLPAFVAAADFNQDGKPDLAVANSGSSSVSILLNGHLSCANSFTTPFSYPVGSTPAAVVAFDLNHDDRTDLATANAGSSSVSVLLGNGLGMFPNKAEYAVGSLPIAISAGDFNQDGYPDLVTANSASDSLSVLIANGDGTYQPRVNYPVTRAGGSYNPDSIAVADLNGDQHLDLATTGYNGSSVGVLFGNGDGTFQAQVHVSLSVLPNAVLHPQSITVGDFNNDTVPDLVTANNMGNTVSVLLGKGNGAFQPFINTFIGGYPNALAVGDLNHDGKADLTVSKAGSKTVSVLLGNGDGAFQSGVDYPVGESAYTVALSDLNSDGNLDISAGVYETGDITLFLGDGSGAFPTRMDVYAGKGIYGIAFGDFNNDTKLDLSTANYDTNSVSVVLSNGNGTFAGQTDYATGGIPAFAVVDDFNRDGKPDLATSNGSKNNVSVLLGNGQGAFLTHTDYPVGGGPYHIAKGDFNNDGKVDLVTANMNSYTISVLMGIGDGTFQPGGTIALTYPPNAVAVGDFNQDGKADLVEVDGSLAVAIWLGNGDGTFQAHIEYETGPGAYPMFVATGDFNHNGILDLVTANYDLGTVSVMLGAGGGYFYPYKQYITDEMPFQVMIEDFNHDGNPDLATANKGGSVSVLFGKSDGTFQPQVSYPIGKPVHDLAASDFNRDGKVDLAVAANGGLLILQGDGSGAFATTVTYPILTGMTTVGDFNRDGQPDLALENTSLSILMNQASPLQAIHSLRSGLWSSPDTWLCRVPTRYDTVTIKSSDAITLDTAGAVLNMTTAGALTVSGNNTLALSGDWTLTGSFTPGSGTITFDGSGAQTLTGETLFHNLVVGSHSILTTSSTVNLTGTLTNLGWTRETQPINGSGIVSYSLGEISLDISNPGTLTSLQVTRRDKNYPDTPPAELQTGRYWSLAPNAGAADFTTSLTLPVSSPSTPSDKVCRYTSPGWDCAQTSRTASYITREGITQFSDWTVLRLIDTQTVLHVDKPSSTYGDSVTLTATLTASLGVPTGTVAFYTDTTLLGNAILDGSGQATFSTSALGAGIHNLTAQYAGEGIYGSSSDTLQGGIIVNKATPTVTFNLESAPVTYDGAPHPVSVAIAASSVPGSVSNIQYNGLVTPPTNAGSSAITADFIPADTENYNAVTGLSMGNFVINKAPLTVTANNQSKIFGANTPIPPLSYTITGFVNGEENMNVVSGEPLLTTTAAANSSVGAYRISITQNSDPLKKLTAANYTFTFVNGTLTITGETLFLPIIMSH